MAETFVCLGEIWLQVQRFLKLRDRLLIPLLAEQDISQIETVYYRLRRQFTASRAWLIAP